jgi:hypothetical protein
MSPRIYALCARLFQILTPVGVGTNLGLIHLYSEPSCLTPRLADILFDKETNT